MPKITLQSNLSTSFSSGSSVLKRKQAQTITATRVKSPKVEQRQDIKQIPSAAVALGSVIPEFGKMPNGRVICPICRADFRGLPEAKRHFDHQHVGVTFPCEICGAELKRKDKL